jgi:ABC-2 type transport system ATP-binding protein
MTSQADPPTAADTVRLDSVRAGYGKRVVLDDVTLRIGDGVTTVIGPNGGGKSTLLKVMATLVAPISGTAEVCGADVGRHSDRRRARRSVGYLEQRARFPAELSVATCLRYAAWLFHVPASLRAGAVAEAVDDFDLRPVADSSLGTLSGGTYQRVMLAASAIHRPRLLVLDEPTAGVDPQSRNAIFQNLRALAKTGTSIVYTTHFMEEAEQLCERVAILDHGRIIALGTVPDLLSAPCLESALRVERDPEPVRTRGLEGLFLDLTGRELRDT